MTSNQNRNDSEKNYGDVTQTVVVAAGRIIDANQSLICRST